jgi:hypothetical protein
MNRDTGRENTRQPTQHKHNTRSKERKKKTNKNTRWWVLCVCTRGLCDCRRAGGAAGLCECERRQLGKRTGAARRAQRNLSGPAAVMWNPTRARLRRSSETLNPALESCPASRRSSALGCGLPPEAAPTQCSPCTASFFSAFFFACVEFGALPTLPCGTGEPGS